MGVILCSCVAVDGMRLRAKTFRLWVQVPTERIVLRTFVAAFGVILAFGLGDFP